MHDGTDTMSRVQSPANMPEAQKGTGVFKKVLSDMTRYARERGYAGISCSRVVNPILLLTLLRQKFSTGSAEQDRTLLAGLQADNLSRNGFYRHHEVLRQAQVTVYRAF